MNISTETRYSVVSALSKEELDEKCKALIELGRIKQVINTYCCRTSRSKNTWIAEVEEN